VLVRWVSHDQTPESTRYGVGMIKKSAVSPVDGW